MKKKNCALFLLVFGFIVIFGIVNLITPDREFSENENKYLATMPSLSWKSLVNGTFATKYETYIADQFLLRDEWITAKSVGEYLLLKTENNGIVYGKDGYMFGKFYSFDEKKLNSNLAAIDAFSFAARSDVYFIAVPSSYYPLVDKLPAGLPYVDENFFIGRVNDYLSHSTTPVNVKDTLAVNSDKYIYYRTDHHWTTYGAWLAYSQFASSAGLQAFSYSSEQPTRVKGFLGTSYSKSKYFRAQPDVIEYFDFSGKITIDGTAHDSIYNLDQFAKRDKYAAFLWGNNGYAEIETDYDVNKLGSILVIKDSYADSFVPFLTEHYNKIVLVDPRYYNDSYKALAEEPFDDVLILFSFENLCNETSITKLGLLES
ncbi:MAG: DHHW family protein [Oscillospiraceae bacterium]|nr:DHHW family protein [Oscillospiraceae bacterium]